MKVKSNIELRISSMGMEENIFRVIVPEEEEVEVKDGKEKVIAIDGHGSYVTEIVDD